MAENKLLRSQKNEIFELIKRNKLNPSDFKWDKTFSKFTKKLEVPILIHQPTDYYYIFDRKGGINWTENSPGINTWKKRGSVIGSHRQLQSVNEWLNRLKKETEPDLWESISKENIFSEFEASSNNDSPFTLEEQKYISTHLHEIERYLISTQNLLENHEEFVKTRLDYLKDASKRQTRQDWKHTMIGVLFTIVVGIRMESSAANELFNLAFEYFQNIFEILTLP